ncbi:tRNA (guanosine(37)-N1)-methyltransferase TrmD [Microgenomates group bacterium RIFCSPLOWO2_01_FULL_46_13]|nr:MAG: tRNA (guanosine(37)-N1)-methyltransferase TrmD [Microgenomates group bacterium RIFCSPHIGHO2_01_FULL_45_11]OGV94904.1 MAG: tRNA (guanosine(37)-N1)-methyltransferase TrmD [Microgenomates group bacterium RIFCSPLOWO2_01_FULL_46_13]
MTIDILTIFPDMFIGPFDFSMVNRAKDLGKVKITIHNLRQWTLDSYKTVDDHPYGGGPGMIMRVDVIDRALQKVKSKTENRKLKTILLSAKGIPFTQKKAQQYSKLNHLILICGHYEGIDQRVADHLADEEISIGPYVLTGGELPTMVIVDTVVRLLPGVVGDPQSLTEESHSQPRYLEYPQYTRPETYQGWKVPKTLLSGHHAAILKWRREHAGKI